MHSSEPDMSTFKVKAKELRNLVDPLDGTMWKCGPISGDEIEEARKKNEFEDRSWSDDEVVHEKLSLEEARSFHIRRIATMLEKGCSGRIAMGLENHTSDVKAYISDGNHSLAAAYIRGDDEIELVIAASKPDEINDLLPSATVIQDNA